MVILIINQAIFVNNVITLVKLVHNLMNATHVIKTELKRVIVVNVIFITMIMDFRRIVFHVILVVINVKDHK